MIAEESDGGVNTHEELEAVLYADEHVLPVIDFNVEFSLKCIVHVDASLNTDLVILAVPVSFVSDWHAVPPVWVQSSKLRTYAPNNTLG